MNKTYAKCHATIEGGEDGTLRTTAYRECKDIAECEKFYQELGYNFYGNNEIKHYGSDEEGHRYYLDVDDKKSMVNYVRGMAKNVGTNLTITDENLVLFALSYLGANMEDALLSGLVEEA